ncbi:hypothetical protein [Actinoplanes sp. URMC 104]|uniref:hypothetical protein n=1 Tax=Actinoplanes sp. URMC 104 TaxID=3423409 RepID=UPI003F19E5D6
MERDDALFVEGRRVDVVNQPHRQLVAICGPTNRPGDYETVFRLRNFQRASRDELADRETLAALTRWLLAHGAEDLGPADEDMLGSLGLVPYAWPADQTSFRDNAFSGHVHDPSPSRPPADVTASVDEVRVDVVKADQMENGGEARLEPPEIPEPTAAQIPAMVRSANTSLKTAITMLSTLDELERETQRLLRDMRDVRAAALAVLTRLDLSQSAPPTAPAPAVPAVFAMPAAFDNGAQTLVPTAADIPVVVHADTPVSISAENLATLVDTERLEVIRAETQRAQATLAALEEAEERARPGDAPFPADSSPTGLSPGLLALATMLSRTDRFGLSEFRLHAERLGLVPLEVIRRINDWAVEQSEAAGAGVETAVVEVDEDDGCLWIDDYLKELLA